MRRAGALRSTFQYSNAYARERATLRQCMEGGLINIIAIVCFSLIAIFVRTFKLA